MRNINRFFCIYICKIIHCSFLFLVLINTPALAASKSNGAGANPKKTITIAQVRDMNFATIFPDPAGDTITMDFNSVRSAVGSSSFGNTAQSAHFFARGEGNASATVSFSSGDVLTGPGQAMALNNFTPDSGFVFQFPSNGKINIFVGADLIVNASQVSGQYTGTYVISVNYQ